LLVLEAKPILGINELANKYLLFTSDHRYRRLPGNSLLSGYDQTSLVVETCPVFLLEIIKMANRS